ncbi:hypothetical protein ACQ4PT_005389 [Festuca glaucescens]
MALKKPALALLLAGALLAAAAGPNHHAAAAASGSRVGGSAFSSSRRSSPPSSYGYSAPAPGGGYSGYSSTRFYSPSPFVSVGPAGFGFHLTLMGFAAFLYLSGFLTSSSGGGSMLTDTQKTTVLKLQVGVKRSIDDGEKRFNQLSIEERGKFDDETLVNVNSIKRQKADSQRSSGFSNEYIVVFDGLCWTTGLLRLFIVTEDTDHRRNSMPSSASSCHRARGPGWTLAAP